jgi:hypothetical protein
VQGGVEDRGELPRGKDHHAVTVGDDDVAIRDRHAAELDRLPDRARVLLRRATQGDRGAERGKPERLQPLSVSHATVDHQAANPALLGCDREDLAPVPVSGAAGIDHEHFAGLGCLNSQVQGKVVPRRGAHRQRRSDHGGCPDRAQAYGQEAVESRCFVERR